MKKYLFLVFSTLLSVLSLSSCTDDSAVTTADGEAIRLASIDETFESINKELVASLGTTRGDTKPGNGEQVKELKDTIRVILKDA